MREFSIIAVCSYSVHKYHRECAKTHFVIRNTKIFLGRGPPVPLSDGLDTRPCKILDPPLMQGQGPSLQGQGQDLQGQGLDSQ